jgi:hypothetical protein
LRVLARLVTSMSAAGSCWMSKSLMLPTVVMVFFAAVPPEV